MGQRRGRQGETSRSVRVADTGGEMARGIPILPARLTVTPANEAQALPTVATNSHTMNATRISLYIPPSLHGSDDGKCRESRGPGIGAAGHAFCSSCQPGSGLVRPAMPGCSSQAAAARGGEVEAFLAAGPGACRYKRQPYRPPVCSPGRSGSARREGGASKVRSRVNVVSKREMLPS